MYAFSDEEAPRVGRLVLARSVPSMQRHKLALLEEVIAALIDLGLAEDRALRARLCLDEAITNAITHGNRHDATLNITVEVRDADDSWVVTITDQGVGFDPASVLNPCDAAGLMRESGRGLLLMHELVDHVAFYSGGRTVLLSQRLGLEP